MDFDYTYKPPKEKVAVGYINTSQLEYYSDLWSELIKVTEIYGVRLHDLEKSDFEKNTNFDIKHVIIITQRSEPFIITEQYKGLLDWYHTISIVLTYEDEEEMLSHASEVEQLKAKYNNRINYLRPDITTANRMKLVSIQKILDNAICDTIRIKYVPNQVRNNSVFLNSTHKELFQKISEIYNTSKLYHRAVSDGFIAIRHQDGFYITATKTKKYPLDLKRISFVHSYTESTNELVFSGKYLPSSDVVEASYVFKYHPQVTALIHTHASDKFTRNPIYADKIKIERMPYGEPVVGKAINKIIGDYYDDFIILEEHGEMFALTGEEKNIAHKLQEIIDCSLNSKVKAWL